LAAAARRPESVGGLLLCSPPLPGWRPPLYVKLLDRAARTRRPERTATLCFRAGFLTLNSWEFFRPAPLVRLRRLAREAADARTPPTTIFEKLTLLFTAHPGLPPSEARLPCSILAGAWDPVTPLSGARRLAEALPGARLRALRLAGHSCAYSRPATYGAWAVEELRRLAGSGA
jgi:pimeloyl-ACP methyl ester carboxylesterase